MRLGSRRSTPGVKEKYIDFFRFSDEYHTLIWALKGPKIKQNMCLKLIPNNLVNKLRKNVCVGPNALTKC